jgi:hypothetical protein
VPKKVFRLFFRALALKNKIAFEKKKRDGKKEALETTEWKKIVSLQRARASGRCLAY